MIQEIEIKFKVNSHQDLCILEKKAQSMFPGQEVKEVSQTNFFFDTPTFLSRKSSIGIRLRKEDDRYLMTIKGPKPGKKESGEQNITTRLEFEAPVSCVDAEKILRGEKNPIVLAESLSLEDERMRRTRDHLLQLIDKVCHQDDLNLIGSFENRRRILPILIGDHFVKLEFDHTLFMESVINFEVELEIPSMDLYEAAEQFLIDLFHQCNLTPGHQKSKSERFYSFLTKQLKA